MNVCGRDGGVPDCDTQLMEVSHHIPHGVQRINRRLLVLIYFQVSELGTLCAKCCCEFRANMAAHGRVQHVHGLPAATFRKN